jgi:hypothetical protein
VAGGQVFGGGSWQRSRTRDDCSTSYPGAFVDPNAVRFCDDFALDIPHSFDFRLGVSYPLPWGLTFGASYLNNDEGSVSPTYLFAGSTRYPGPGAPTRFVNGILETTGMQEAPACPAPCPAGALVAGSSYVGSTAGTTVALSYGGQYDAERLKQIDLKLSKTFRVRGVTIAPTVEVFNATNQDLVITYVSQSYANSSGTYLRPNSLLQGRIVGWGTRVTW